MGVKVACPQGPFPDRRGGAEAALPGLEPGRERMDHARQGMVLGQGSVCCAFRRALHTGRGLNVNPPLPARNPGQSRLAAIPDTSISGRRVARELSALVARRGGPGMIVSDNGVHVDGHPRVGRGSPHRLALHRAGQAHPERLRGELQRPDARRAAEREPDLQP